MYDGYIMAHDPELVKNISNDCILHLVASYTLELIRLYDAIPITSEQDKRIKEMIWYNEGGLKTMRTEQARRAYEYAMKGIV